MYLVEVHAQVCAAAEPLLARVLNFLAEELAREALDCFSKVPKFGMGGMLRVSVLFSVISMFLAQLTKLCSGHAGN